MKYSPIAHFINILFLGFIFIFPFVLCLHLSNLSNGGVAGVIAGCWLLGAVLFADWYYLHWTDTFKGCLSAIAIGLLVAGLSLFLESLMSDATLSQLLKMNVNAWHKNRLLMKSFVTGIALIGCGILSIPRILFIRLFAKDETPIDTFNR
ncbi:MAG: hypothetical protein EHM79_13920 [Geobacter sp.]|nr:MAG: hypothetical protein EHM79_13920 [Geobacter sp.]